MEKPMSIRTRLTFLILLFCLLSQIAIADGRLISWSTNDVSGVTEQSFNATKLYTVDEIQKKNLEVTSWADAYLLMVGALQHKDDGVLLKALVSQISNATIGGLKATSRLIIWERITTGDILFEGKGYQISDDLFRVAGRANWILRALTGKTLGYVKPKTSEADLAVLQAKWTKFLAGDQVAEFEEPYPTNEKGLSVIRSREALEALIVSLAPSSNKDRLTRDCLKRLYGLDKLPDDPQAPGALCNPDQYTFGYLSVITGVKDERD